MIYTVIIYIIYDIWYLIAIIILHYITVISWWTLLTRNRQSTHPTCDLMLLVTRGLSKCLNKDCSLKAQSGIFHLSLKTLGSCNLNRDNNCQVINSKRFSIWVLNNNNNNNKCTILIYLLRINNRNKWWMVVVLLFRLWVKWIKSTCNLMRISIVRYLLTANLDLPLWTNCNSNSNSSRIRWFSHLLLLIKYRIFRIITLDLLLLINKWVSIDRRLLIIRSILVIRILSWINRYLNNSRIKRLIFRYLLIILFRNY